MTVMKEIAVTVPTPSKHSAIAVATSGSVIDVGKAEGTCVGVT